jgi:3-hydroxybutyryl-CoA dehydrogenase
VVGPGAGAAAELTGGTPQLRRQLGCLFRDLGLATAEVPAGSGFIAERIITQLINEACFAVGEGVASPADIDLGLTLGLRHPRGPLAWGQTLGLDRVATNLAELWNVNRSEVYRQAPALRPWSSRRTLV